MKKIFKYNLLCIGSQTIDLPYSIEIISVIEQRGEIVVYGIIDTEDVKYPREFRVYGTGHPLDEDIEDFIFLDTVSTEKGILILHIFVAKSHR